MRKLQILVLLAAAVGAAWLTTWVDDGRGTGWTQDVIRNWEQFGFFNLQGKLVVNPGGFEAATQPEIYAGHRPASLYLASLCHRLFGGSDCGFLFYYALMSGVVLLSIWQLLGRTERAFWLAAMGVLTPGFVRWQTTLDPNLAAVLFGFPFCAAVLVILRQPGLKATYWAGLFALILIYSSVNWTTIFIHGMLFVTLLVLPRVSWRHLFIYAGLTAALAGLVLLASLASKIKPASGSGSGMVNMLQAYGWGNAGYGLNISTSTDCLRLLATNLIGLLPVLLFLGWQWWRCRRPLAGGWIFLLPAFVPMVEVLGMRNYFGHHPWMSVHFILLGLILAIVVWKDRGGAAAAGEIQSRPAWALGGLAATFAYSVIVLAAGQVHNERELGLEALIQEHTSRDAVIVISHGTDPALADMESRLPEMFDRHVVVVPDTSASSLAGVPGKRMFLTASNPLPAKIIGQTDSDHGGSPVLKKMLGWYSRHIAHRRAGDKLELGEKYFLYQPAN